MKVFNQTKFRSETRVIVRKVVGDLKNCAQLRQPVGARPRSCAQSDQINSRLASMHHVSVVSR